MTENKLSFPIGPYIVPDPIRSTHLQEWIETIKTFPSKLEKAVLKLDDKQLSTPYRPDGWTVKQLVHHIADSHMNAYIRLKLGMTEDNPSIKPYDQEAWARLPDSGLSIAISIGIIKGLHHRWFCCLESFQDWDRSIFHPELKTKMNLDELTGMYAWHSEHHLAHITNLMEREGW